MKSHYMIFAFLLFNIVYAADIKEISMTDAYAHVIDDKVPLYKNAWKYGRLYGKPFTIQSDQEFRNIVNERVILAAQQSYWPIKVKTIFEESECQKGAALFTFFQELRNAQVLSDEQNKTLDFHITRYTAYNKNLE
ncbi:MAG TPA: hypothetical protein VGW78_02325 [Candidatus Babeliales bacterium]|jgi:hypothetical protein|nr:hypothetical protein [Candidatus Babeliales bacterium]